MSDLGETPAPVSAQPVAAIVRPGKRFIGHKSSERRPLVRRMLNAIAALLAE